MIEQKRFSGIMNTDDSDEFIAPGQHKDARNGRFYGGPQGLRFENIKGTTLIPNEYLPDGDNECIGSFYDGLRQRILWFNWNSEGRNGIYQYDLKTATVSEILVSYTDSQDDIFGFDINYPIPSVVLLYTTEDDGDILHWTARNNRPMKLNLKDATDNLYGTHWLADYLYVARQMPLIAPNCSYQDDATVNINNLRKKLYEFRYRWTYTDFTKSTWSPWSKLFAPANPDDIANDIDEQKNNRIDVVINTGNADVLKVEIAARQTLAATFSDPFLVDTINKAELDLLDNQLYTYEFLNNSSYPNIDLAESDLLFDYVPRVANTLELLNGNVIIYGGILEGYDFDEVLDVELAVSSVPFTTALGLTATKIYENITQVSAEPQTWTYESLVDISGTPNSGDTVSISYNNNGLSPDSISYTVLPGDTVADIVLALVNAFNALTQNPTNQYIATVVGDGIHITTVGGMATLLFLQINNITVVQSGSGGVVDGVSNSIYKHKSRYGIGLIYFDQFGVTNGVVIDPAEMLFETPEVTTTGDSVSEIPQIDIQINHQPPVWATNFSFVRTNNLSVQSLLTTVSASTKVDGGTPNYAYIEITNQQNNQNNYSAYEFTDGDRVRILGKYGTAIGTVYDFPISSFKSSPTINGAVVTGSFLVIPYDAVLSSFGTAGFEHYTIEIYTPAPNIGTEQQLFFEFGETYEVLDAGTSSRRHQGQSQNQIVGSQPALYTFVRGDFYIRKRKIPFNADLSAVTNIWIIDQSVSDLFPSRIVGNGRAFIIDKDARENYFPTLLRWGLQYQQNTDINQTNRFYPQNFDEIDRAKGDIQRFKVRDRILRVFQNRACGQYGVYSRFIQNNSGGNELVTTNDIITANNINYYRGEFGLGDQYCGLVSSSGQDYFVDPVRGYQIRLSYDGITPISELYKGQFYISSLFTPYNKAWVRADGSLAKILGCFDFVDDQYVTILQGSSITPDNRLTLGTETVGDTFIVTLGGVPTIGYKITIEVEFAVPDTFEYTVQPGDTIETILAAIMALVNASAGFTATVEGDAITIEGVGVGFMSGAATMSYNGTSSTIDDYAFSFNEKRNGYCSWYDFHPEWIMSAEDTIYSWLNGSLYAHNSNTYCNFYGVQYDCSITLPFNQSISQKKTWVSITELASSIWAAPLIYTNADTYTGQRQESLLIADDFANLEKQFSASFLRDYNSPDGLINGDTLKGSICVIKLNQSNASSLVYLSELSIKFIISPLTNR